MKYFLLIFFSLHSLHIASIDFDNWTNGDMKDSIKFKSGYSEVNGIKMYYEIYGAGEPLVLIHGGGSTIQTTFGKIIPVLAKHFTLIAMDLQNHGRTGTRNVKQTFEQDAEDVISLLKNLGISKASVLGFSNGGTTALEIGIRYPEYINKLIIIAGVYKREGLINGFFDGMNHASLSNMPHELKEAFLKVNPDSSALQNMFEKDRDRMISFQDIDEIKIRSIHVPALIISGDTDVVKAEHTFEMFRAIPNSRLAILPGSHGECIGEITTKVDHDLEYVVALLKSFLE